MESISGPQLNFRHAFIVDDDVAIQKFMTEALTEKGFKIEAFRAAKPALAALGADHPAIIFLDLSLLHSDAIDVLIGLGAEDYNGVVHLMSAGRPQLVEAVQRLGVRHRVRLARPLGKPITQKDIAQAVSDLDSTISTQSQQRTTTNLPNNKS
jgi:DNA-binding NtrC family response regulator